MPVECTHRDIRSLAQTRAIDLRGGMFLCHIAVSDLPPVPYKTVETAPEKASVIVLLLHVNATILHALSCDAPLKSSKR